MKHYWLCLQSHIRSPCKSGGTIEDVALFGFLFMSERQQSITTSNMTVGVQVIPPEKMPFGYFNYLELQALEKQQIQGRGFFWTPLQFSSVQSFSRVQLFVTPWTAACQASLSITNSQSPPKTMSIELVMPSKYLILCCPRLLLPSIFPSTRVFSNESALRIRWPKYWSFSFIISPSNEYSALISFKMDWLDLLAVQGTLKSLLQYHSSKASNLQHSAFFIVHSQSHPYMTTGKTIALTRWTFVGK